MKSFITYKIYGMKGSIISGDIHSFSVTDNLVEDIEISQTNDTICGIKFTLKDNVAVDEDVIAQVDKKAQVFLVNMYGSLHPYIRGFRMKLDQVYDSKREQKNLIELSDSVCFTEDIMIIRSYGVDTFKSFFDKRSLAPNIENFYMLLFNVMQIDNIVVRYLMQYELLLSLVADHHKQAEVSAFIRNKYNPAKVFGKIEFRPTRKNRKAYLEDDITFHRNLLGHNDGSNKVTDKEISELSNALADVLLFALNGKNEAAT